MIRIPKFLLQILALSSLFYVSSLEAVGTCQGHFVNPVTDICWECLFPVSLGEIPVIPGVFPDTMNPKDPFCICPAGALSRIGVSFGYWEPYALEDVTRTPFCMVNLGIPIDVGALSHDMGGQQNGQGTVGYGGFYWAHSYKYPLMYWLQILTDTGCLETGAFDIGYLTELDLLWNDDIMSFVLNPESILFGNPAAQASCAFDAAKTAGGVFMPIDALFWCLGSQGSSYPLTGNYSAHITNVQAATLVSEKLNFKLHREKLALDTIGVDGPALCFEHRSPILPKSRYRYQMVNTVPNPLMCSPYGSTTATWEIGHDDLSTEQNYGFLMWRKRNCCAL